MFWKKRDPAWEKGIRQLKSYKRVNGDANVPIMYVCADGFRRAAGSMARRNWNDWHQID